MSKCVKAKNPCKICLTNVTQRTGLQCQGACESWVHYNCLNYTPGRVKDIKAGVIKITCPCPDCKTVLPKEYRTDEPYSCTNMMCPANRPPQCTHAKCPSNAGKGILCPAKERERERINSQQKYKIAPPTQCPLVSCGNDCKQHVSHPLLPKTHHPPCQSHQPQLPSMASSSETCFSYKPSNCPSGCATPVNYSGDARKHDGHDDPALGAMEQMCNTIGLLSEQMNTMMAEMREKNAIAGMREKSAISAMREKSAISASSPTPSTKEQCEHADKSMCPKPCYCPNNPARK